MPTTRTLPRANPRAAQFTRRLLACLLAWFACAPALHAIELQKETVDAYERYVRDREERARIRLQPGHRFLWIDDSPQRAKLVRSGSIVVEPATGNGATRVPGGLIHDFIAGVFIPGVTLHDVFAVLNDYDHYKEYYKPEVAASRELTHAGNEYTFSMRLRKKAIVLVVEDGTFASTYAALDAARWYGRERSARIVEVEHAGTAAERNLPEGTGHGFLWRLDSFTRFEQRDGGAYLELEALALTRDIPASVAWFVRPIVRRLSRGSLVTSLDDTRKAVAAAQRSRLRP